MLYLFFSVLTSIFAGANTQPLLIIGDSLTCGPFGKQLFEQMNTGGRSVTLYCAVSSAPSHWVKGKTPKGQKCQTRSTAKPDLSPCEPSGQVPKLDSLLSRHPGAEVIVALGTNSLLDKKADANYKLMSDAVAAQGRGCKWIGPPHLNPSQSRGFPAGRLSSMEGNLSGFYESLQTSVGSSCELIDSRAATQSGTPGHQTTDGVHRTEDAGIAWAQSLQPVFNPPSTAEPEAPLAQ